ncbi:MAG: DUF937 domain-containing protein [Acidimicrobiales bacterium]
MSGIFEQLIDLVGTGDELGSISQAIGSEPSATQRGIAAALPLLLGGLANNAQSPQGAASLLGALGGHDGSVLGNLAGLLGGGGGGVADGAKILGHVFGNRTDRVAGAVSQKSGLDIGTVMKLLPVLAPIVMGYLGRRQSQQLASELASERQSVAQKEPELGGLLGILDSDGDGDVMDDLGGLLGGGGGLGSILGMVLGQ